MTAAALRPRRRAHNRRGDRRTSPARSLRRLLARRAARHGWELLAFGDGQGKLLQASCDRETAQSFLDEAPTWAPNGRVLMFFRETPSDAQGKGSTSRLYSVDLTGDNLREVVTIGDASDPAWSPLNP